MTVREYIGARYVPVFDGYWDATKNYEPLTMVISNQEATAGNSYMSKTFVPAGMPLTNSTYWVLTGEYDAQIASIRYDLDAQSGEIDNIEDTVSDNTSAISAITALLESYPNGILKNTSGEMSAATYSDIISLFGNATEFRHKLGANSNGIWGTDVGGVGVSTPNTWAISKNSIMQAGIINYIDTDAFNLTEARYGCMLNIGGTLKYSGAGNWAINGNLGMGTFTVSYRPLVKTYNSYSFRIGSGLEIYTITISVDVDGSVSIFNCGTNAIPNDSVFPFNISYLVA